MKKELNHLLNRYITDYVIRNNHVITTCPYCGKEKHFYINIETGLWDCKRCGEVGNLGKLLRFYGVLNIQKDWDSIDKHKINKLQMVQQKNEKKLDCEVENVEYLKPYRFIKKNKYLQKKRHLSFTDIQRYKVFKTNKPEWIDYVIFPVFQNGELKGYVGRNEGNEGLRYKNSQTKFSRLLYGYDEITDDTKMVFLVEGIFDKIKLDKCYLLHRQQRPEIVALATFGKRLSDCQIQLLRKKKVDTVYLVYDKDAVNEIKKYGIKLLELGFTVYATIPTVNKDIDEMSCREIYDLFNFQSYLIQGFMKSKVGIIKK